jgi:4-hydroxy-tetrahydrodipicolinate synthase
MELILLGAKGDISVTANVAPRAMHEMCAAALAGDRVQAERIDRRLRVLHEDLFIESSPIPVKWALHEMGLIPPGLRLPLTPLACQYHQRVRDALRQAGVVQTADA